MATFDISKELVVTLRYCFEKQKRLSRNHVKIMFAFKSLMRKTKYFLESDILEAVTRSSSTTKVFL